MEEQNTVPVVDGCTHCKHVAEHLRNVGIEVELRPIIDAIPSSLFEGDLWSGFRDDLVSEYEEVR